MLERLRERRDEKGERLGEWRATEGAGVEGRDRGEKDAGEDGDRGREIGCSSLPLRCPLSALKRRGEAKVDKREREKGVEEARGAEEGGI